MVVYLLKQKLEYFSTFQKYKAMFENKMGKIIQTLRNDNEGVYKSTDFNEFCQLNGILRHFSIPYTPQ